MYPAPPVTRIRMVLCGRCCDGPVRTGLLVSLCGSVWGLSCGMGWSSICVSAGCVAVERGRCLADLDHPRLVSQHPEPVFALPGAAELEPRVTDAVLRDGQDEHA